jgi:hypothetical protein
VKERYRICSGFFACYLSDIIGVIKYGHKASQPIKHSSG